MTDFYANETGACALERGERMLVAMGTGCRHAAGMSRRGVEGRGERKKKRQQASQRRTDDAGIPLTHILLQRRLDQNLLVSVNP